MILLWERLEWILCSKECEEKWELCWSKCQEEKKGERRVKMNNSNAKPVKQLLSLASGRFSEGTSASRKELNLPRNLGEGGGAGNSGSAKGRKRSMSNFPSQLSMEEDASLGDL